ncbi:hypothetical protein VitviT2T_030440 [Vitis vinifera]|uniref:Uncharacterized protein n=3 Tax=Vitis vinifera TaxID=29760 RepID=A0ABY9E0K7_VITVI|nr:hypothetical protein CK203_060130 [Vitis vinifera]WKA13107.1 hypothetical protein VitviT2T_030440 [Vitis vinifera]
MEMELLMGEVFETVSALKRAVKAREVEVKNLKEKLKNTTSLTNSVKKGRFQSKKKVSCNQVRSIEMATIVTDATMNTAISVVGSHHAKHALESYRSETTKSQTVIATSLLLPLSSPISPSTMDVRDVGSANGAIKSSFLNYTKLFFAPKLGRSVVRRGFRSPSTKASFDHIPNSSKREIYKMD